jgi:UDP-glucose 4-epimerase
LISRVLVTGATGFVGRTLCRTLADAGLQVRAAVRRPDSGLPASTEQALVGDVDARTDWDSALREVDVVVHAAARAHVMGAHAGDLALYDETNARGTARLAQAASDAHIRRFVYVSSIKVNGEERPLGAYRADDAPDPRDPYAISKHRGEKAVLAVGGAMQTAIVRPPLVYGPGVRANFLRLLRWVDRQLPLPLAAIRNRRSLVSVWNLCDLLHRLATRPTPSGCIWLVSDGEDLSTPALIRRIGIAMRRNVRLLPVPPAMLRLGGMLLGRDAEIARLCGSLAIDITATRQMLEWSPPLSVDESLARTVRWYLHEGRAGAG